MASALHLSATQQIESDLAIDLKQKISGDLATFLAGEHAKHPGFLELVKDFFAFGEQEAVNFVSAHSDDVETFAEEIIIKAIELAGGPVVGGLVEELWNAKLAAVGHAKGN